MTAHSFLIKLFHYIFFTFLLVLSHDADSISGSGTLIWNDRWLLLALPVAFILIKGACWNSPGSQASWVWKSDPGKLVKSSHHIVTCKDDVKSFHKLWYGWKRSSRISLKMSSFFISLPAYQPGMPVVPGKWYPRVRSYHVWKFWGKKNKALVKRICISYSCKKKILNAHTTHSWDFGSVFPSTFLIWRKKNPSSSAHRFMATLTRTGNQRGIIRHCLREPHFTLPYLPHTDVSNQIRTRCDLTEKESL